MGYDRNDPWMTCGERDDKEASETELAKLFSEQTSYITPGMGIRLARALLSNYHVIAISNGIRGGE